MRGYLVKPELNFVLMVDTLISAGDWYLDARLVPGSK
jgi:hypothetical protein